MLLSRYFKFLEISLSCLSFLREIIAFPFSVVGVLVIGSVDLNRILPVKICTAPVLAGGSPVHTKVQRPRGHQ